MNYTILVRVEFRGETARREVYNRIVCWLHKRYGSQLRQIGQRFVAHSASDCHEARKCERGLHRQVRDSLKYITIIIITMFE